MTNPRSRWFAIAYGSAALLVVLSGASGASPLAVGVALAAIVTAAWFQFGPALGLVRGRRDN